MEKVTAKDVQRQFGRVRTKAHQAGVMITHHGHDDLALVPADEYKRLKAMDLQAHAVDELPEDVVSGFGTEPIADEVGAFDHELR